MPPRQAKAEPEPPAAPPPPEQTGGQGAPVDDRLKALEDHSERQDQTLAQHGGLLTEIRDMLKGRGQSAPQPAAPSAAAADPDEGKPIAQLVREGVEKLEAEKETKRQKETEASERANHAARIKALEESRPREVAATPAGRVRAAVQRYGFGIEDPRH